MPLPSATPPCSARKAGTLKALSDRSSDETSVRKPYSWSCSVPTVPAIFAAVGGPWVLGTKVVSARVTTKPPLEVVTRSPSPASSSTSRVCSPTRGAWSWTNRADAG